MRTEEYFKNYVDQKYDDLLHWHMPLLGLFPSWMLNKFFHTNFGTSMGFTSVPAVQFGAKFWEYEVKRMAKVFGFQWGNTG